MTRKTDYLRSVAARLQRERMKLAKLRADVRSNALVTDEAKARLEELNASIGSIQSDLTALARAGHNEWRCIKQRLDQHLSALAVPSEAELTRRCSH